MRQYQELTPLTGHHLIQRSGENPGANTRTRSPPRWLGNRPAARRLTDRSQESRPINLSQATALSADLTPSFR